MASPETVQVQRHDTGEIFPVPMASLRWGVPLKFVTLAWGMTVSADKARDTDVAYLRIAPDSRMCVRVTVLPSLSQAFSHWLVTPTADGSEVRA